MTLSTRLAGVMGAVKKWNKFHEENGGARHHVLCNYPTDVNGWCNCGVADLRAALAALDRSLKE